MKIEKLFLKNFLIIEKAGIELSTGMTTVTGGDRERKESFYKCNESAERA